MNTTTWCLAAGVALLSIFTTSASAATWSNVASDGIHSSTRPALHRSENGNLQIAWTKAAVDSTAAILRKGITASGIQSQATTTVVTGWQKIGSPALTSAPDEKVIAWFGGDQASGSVSPFKAGALSAAISTSSTATGWQPVTTSLSQSDEVLAAGHLSADRSASDTPVWLTWAGSSGITVAAGSHGGLDGESVVGGTAAASSASIAVDRASQSVWISWCDASTGSIKLQQVSPVGGASEAVGESSCSASLLARANTGRVVHGGVFLASCLAATPCQKIRMLSLPGGKRFDVQVPSGTRARNVALASAPTGKIWIIWESVDEEGKAGSVMYTRTDSNVRRVGQLQEVELPAVGSTVSWIGGDGSSGSDPSAPLDLASVLSASDGRSSSINYVRVIPALEISGRTKGFRTRISVTEAGDAVVNAYVRFRGRKGFTNKKGQIAFSFERGWSRKKRFKATASKKGYIDSSTLIAGSMKR